MTDLIHFRYNTLIFHYDKMYGNNKQ